MEKKNTNPGSHLGWPGWWKPNVDRSYRTPANSAVGPEDRAATLSHYVPKVGRAESSAW